MKTQRGQAVYDFLLRMYVIVLDMRILSPPSRNSAFFVALHQ